MVDGLLSPLPNVSNPQQGALDQFQQLQARQQGLLTPGAMGMRQPQQPQQGYMTPGNLNEIYGILAQGARNPQQVGQQYVGAMQTQQQIDRQNQPIEQFLRLYGRINPYDYSPESIQAFHENYLNTGQLQFDLLQERQKLSSTEEKRLFDSYDRLTKSASMMGRMGNLAHRFQQAAASGEWRPGLYGTLDAWANKHLTGGQDEMSALRTEYLAMRNQDVIQNLPPGVASDRDIAIAQEGWPPPNAGAGYLAAFLRGMQKMKALTYAKALHENAYISANKNPGQMAQDWIDKRNEYVIETMKANNLPIDYGGKPAGEYTDEELQQYADQIRQSLTAGTGPVDQTGAPARGTVIDQAGNTAQQVGRDIDSLVDKYKTR